MIDSLLNKFVDMSQKKIRENPDFKIESLTGSIQNSIRKIIIENRDKIKDNLNGKKLQQVLKKKNDLEYDNSNLL